MYVLLSSKCIFSYVPISEQFKYNKSLHNKVCSMCILHFIGSSVIFVDIQTGIITTFNVRYAYVQLFKFLVHMV